MVVGGALWLYHFVRTETTAAFVIALMFALIATEGNLPVRCKRAVAALLGFVALASRVAIFIYNSPGKVRLEMKSTIFFYTGKRILPADRKPGGDYEPPGVRHE